MYEPMVSNEQEKKITLFAVSKNEQRGTMSQRLKEKRISNNAFAVNSSEQTIFNFFIPLTVYNLVFHLFVVTNSEQEQILP